MQVAEDLLVRADEERGDEVVLAVVGVQLEHALHVAAVDEAVDLAVGVAGDVGQHAAAVGLFVQPVDRHDREELVDRPGVGHRLEDRVVAEVRVGEHRLQALELVGDVVELADDVQDLRADAEEQPLGQAAVLERAVAEAEQVQHRVLADLGVVVVLHEVLLVHAAVGVEQVHDRRGQSCALGVGERRCGRSKRAKPLQPITLNTSTLWYATIARPDSLMIVGCSTPAWSQISLTWKTTSLAYSCRP